MADLRIVYWLLVALIHVTVILRVTPRHVYSKASAGELVDDYHQLQGPSCPRPNACACYFTCRKGWTLFALPTGAN